MPYTRYRSIVKVLCDDCQLKVNQRNVIDTKCKGCKYLKYNNVNRLIKFTTFLNTEFPNWVYFNLFEYKKGEVKGRKLASFQKGKNEPISDTL